MDEFPAMAGSRTSDKRLTGWPLLVERLYRLTHGGQIRTLVLSRDQIIAQGRGLSLLCRVHGGKPHRPCSGTTDDGTNSACLCWCHDTAKAAGGGRARSRPARWAHFFELPGLFSRVATWCYLGIALVMVAIAAMDIVYNVPRWALVPLFFTTPFWALITSWWTRRCSHLEQELNNLKGKQHD
jgi:hypothetical protein